MTKTGPETGHRPIIRAGCFEPGEQEVSDLEAVCRRIDCRFFGDCMWAGRLEEKIVVRGEDSDEKMG